MIRQKLALCCLVLCAAACDPVQQVANKREQVIASSQPLGVGIVWDSEHGSFFQRGVEIAFDELNEKGGVLGRTLQPVHVGEQLSGKDQRELAADARGIARRLAKTPSVFAVIGHSVSASAIAASVTYNRFGLLYLVPGATSPLLTHLGFQNLFRTIEDDQVVGETLATFCSKRKYRTLAILSERSQYGLGLASEFFEAANDGSHNVHVVMRRSLEPGASNYFTIIDTLRKANPDAVLLAVNLDVGIQFLNEAKQLGYQGQFIAGDGLFSNYLLAAARHSAQGLIVATSVGFQSHDPAFIQTFRKRYGIEPNGWAQQGYDSVMLLAAGVQRANSFKVVDVAAAIRNNQLWHGAFGAYTFAENGQMNDRKIYLLEVKGDTFVRVAEYRFQTPSQGEGKTGTHPTVNSYLGKNKVVPIEPEEEPSNGS